ncbi:hypothetical protein [Flavobacterium sp.]|uniref:hypothetical protein n=1 Tax=Flavobacterium sp. TaxID=239 RepID=UPI001B78A669|nr:hypothetical protein [Flavobacterium sp.]MBP6126592.1 hypothetical protein [Flavobacterium sp.]
MQKFGSCEFTVNDLVLYTSRFGDSSVDIYEIIEVLPNKDGKYEDKPFTENYWIRNIKTKKEYLVYHSELKLK